MALAPARVDGVRDTPLMTCGEPACFVGDGPRPGVDGATGLRRPPGVVEAAVVGFRAGVVVDDMTCATDAQDQDSCRVAIDEMVAVPAGCYCWPKRDQIE